MYNFGTLMNEPAKPAVVNRAESVLVLQTKNVLLDTQVFISNNFNFESRACKKIAELVAEDRAKVFVTEVTVREVKKRIKTQLVGAQTYIARAKKEARI